LIVFGLSFPLFKKNSLFYRFIPRLLDLSFPLLCFTLLEVSVAHGRRILLLLFELEDGILVKTGPHGFIAGLGLTFVAITNAVLLSGDEFVVFDASVEGRMVTREAKFGVEVRVLRTPCIPQDRFVLCLLDWLGFVGLLLDAFGEDVCN
jgi:hypothetical protein